MIQIKKIGKKIAQILSIVIVVLEMIIIAALLITKMTGGVPTVFGHNFYVIASPSMSPELEVGDVIISKKYDGGELKVNDVVEFVGKQGDIKGKIITHKIISITGEGDDRVIVTKGVANSEPDAPIAPSDIIAVMKYKTVVIDKIFAITTSTLGFICLVMLPMMAIIVTEIVRLAIDIKREKDGGQKDE